MTKIFLVRHCESEGNACRRSHAMYDGIITVKGIQQNEALSRRFEGIHIDAVYSSDAYRARMTAKAIAERHGLTVKPRMLFREYNVGVWEGLPSGNVPRLFPKEYDAWYNTPWAMITPGGDNYEIVRDRVLEGIRRVINEVGDGVALISTHAYTLRVLLCELSGLPKERMGEIAYGDNTSVSLICAEDAAHIKIEFMGDNSHLPPHLCRSWPGMAGKSINMAVDNCSLPGDTKKVLDCAEKQHKLTAASLPFDGEAQIHDAQRRLAHNRQAVTFYALEGLTRGMMRLEFRGDGDIQKLLAEHLVISDIYMDLELRQRSFDMQPLGHAFQIARELGKKYVAIKPLTDADSVLAARFPCEPVPLAPGYIRILVTVPGCDAPVI